MNARELAYLVQRSGGSVHGSCNEWTDLEFSTLPRAIAFLSSMEWTDVAELRDAVTDLRATVVVQVPNLSVAFWGTDEHLKHYLKGTN
ncbi:hypothetical protein [Streptomyces tendae]|uniref:hypothetical protein n=1 Tax=Streptomyces tendae TaxID=1932 RepID=UPI0036514C66